MSGGPRLGLYTIAPGHAFLTHLARGVIERYHRPDDPLALSAVTIFLPTRRGERQLRDELVRAADAEALIMPSIRVLGDVDEDEASFVGGLEDDHLAPEIGRLERDLILARRLDDLRREAGSAGGFGVSLALAKSLSRLIDDAANEDADLSGIADLAPGDLAQHWAATVRFLETATREWPQALKARDRMDPVERRNRLIRLYAMRLAAERPTDPFIVAGSSGSVRATADLMKVVAELPDGAVVFDGLDTRLEAESWDVLPPSHPQFALKETLIYLGVDRSAVRPWPEDASGEITPRAVFLSEAMRPPETAEKWAERVRAERPVIASGTQGLERLEAANEREEALCVALAIRQAIEEPEKTVALVTADRMLARRVQAELRRWNISADDSAGRPLAKTEAGATITLSLDAARQGGTPLSLLSLLKHPCMALGRQRSDVLRLARRLERRVLRPERVTGGFEAARQAIALSERLRDEDREPLTGLIDAVEEDLGPLLALAGGRHDLATLAGAHVDALDRLTRDPDTGRSGAWKGTDGEAAYAMLQEIVEAGQGAGLALSMDEYAIVVDSAARSRAVRPQGPRHQRISIWGPLEARMQSADLMILGGLNEGVWPANPADDPWLSRPMRTELKLSAPERRIGLAAHDFVTLAAHPHVLLTRSKRKDGAPATPSRFLLRITTLAEGAEAPIAESPLLDIARRLDVAGPAVPAPRPMPRPPKAARPRLLSVTRIETWVRDPYAIYAEHVLRLKPLDHLMQVRDARDRGMMIHAAIEAFAARSNEGDPYETLLQCGEQAFGVALDDPDVRAFWWPRFKRAARWLADQEKVWAETRAASVVEVRRELHLADVDFTLTGQPDRIDRLKSGDVRVIDYKTGSIPTKKQVAAFMAPQLPLLAAMAAAGAFGDDLKGEPAELVYAHVSGGRIEGKAFELENPAELVEELMRRLKERVRQFDDEKTPYQPRKAVQSTRHHGDYDHLSRLDEWGGANEAEL